MKGEISRLENDTVEHKIIFQKTPRGRSYFSHCSRTWDPHFRPVYPRHLQLFCGSVVTPETPSRLAPASPSNPPNLSTVGSFLHRSFCNTSLSRSPHLCDTAGNGPESCLYRCLLSGLEFSPSLGVPTISVNSSCTSPREQCQRPVYPSLQLLGWEPRSCFQELPQLYSSRQKISKDKYTDLQKMKPQIPRDLHRF